MTVVVFGAEKGGVGKTSLALNFTVLAASAGADAVLLDTDRQSTASNWLALRREDAELSAISVLANSADPLREVESLSRRFQLVVVDIGAQNYRALVECALLADAYIVPTSTSALDLDTAEDLFHMLDKLKRPRGASPIIARAALCKVPGHPASKEVARTRDRLADSGITAMASALPLRSAWRSMANTGKALHELQGRDQDTRATQEMFAFYEEIVEALKR